MHSSESFPDGAAAGSDRSSTPSPPARGASTGFGSPGTDATVKRIDTFPWRSAGNIIKAAKARA